MTLPLPGAATPSRRAWAGALVGFMTTVVLTILLLAFQGDEGDIDSAPVWWTFIVLTAVVVGVTGLLLICSRTWRRFGVGFFAGVLVALPAEVVVYVALWALAYSESGGG